LSGVTFDAGALIAFERGDRRVVAILARALHRRERVVVPAGVVGQAWRDGRRQVRLARLLASPIVHVEPLDDRGARIAGQLCGVARTRDVVDASVVACARAHRHSVVTSDTRDLRRLDATLTLIEL
jgi:predicted nucleic acid-binding protein